ncbi:MAG: PrgI family protein [Candidatus Nealsonbacteria bacterium]
MPEFTIPQFIEEKPKIVGPLNFKQFIFFGIAGIICFILYFTAPFYLFILGTIVLLLGAGALAFIKIDGIPLPTVILNFISFLFSSRIYLWRKKDISPRFVKKPKEIEEAEEGESDLKIAKKSQLKTLSTRIETGIK